MMTTRDEGLAMLAAGRRVEIVERLRRDGIVRVRELASALKVSDVTIRRDIDALVELGGVEKVHGGARFLGNLSHDEPAFESKKSWHGPEKQAIAREAAKLVTAGMVVGISAGTTTFLLPTLLRNVPDLTIITNSIPVAIEFDRPHGDGGSPVTVLLTGGESTPSSALVGPLAMSAIRRLHVDLLLLGVHGMDEQAGLTTPNLREAEFNQAFIEAAKRVAVLADSAKWATVGMTSIGPLECADILITDAGISDEARRSLEQRVGQVIVARPESETGVMATPLGDL
jgi:DeoR/GlpR family transcriptional regulator of sugar metabolism